METDFSKFNCADLFFYTDDNIQKPRQATDNVKMTTSINPKESTEENILNTSHRQFSQ